MFSNLSVYLTLTTHFHAHKPQPSCSIATATLDSSGVLETLSPSNLQPNHEAWTSFQLAVQTSGVQGHESFTSVTYTVSSLPRSSDCISLHVKRSVSQDWWVHVAHESSNTVHLSPTQWPWLNTSKKRADVHFAWLISKTLWTWDVDTSVACTASVLCRRSPAESEFCAPPAPSFLRRTTSDPTASLAGWCQRSRTWSPS